MSALASERLKLATTRTTVWLAAALIGIVTLAAIVHILGFDVGMVDDATEQRSILTDIGVSMGVVFAAISGSLAITAEFRYGTIRPTLLKHPNRSSLLIAKLITQTATGAALASAATAYAIAVTAAFLRARGLSLELDAGQNARLVVGAGLGGAGFAVWRARNRNDRAQPGSRRRRAAHLDAVHREPATRRHAIDRTVRARLTAGRSPPTALPRSPRQPSLPSRSPSSPQDAIAARSTFTRRDIP